MSKEGKLGKLAIITYRIAKDGLGLNTTVSTEVILTAVEVARKHGIEFLWLDCWTYRRQPPWASYEHQHFCGEPNVVDGGEWLADLLNGCLSTNGCLVLRGSLILRLSAPGVELLAALVNRCLL